MTMALKTLVDRIPLEILNEGKLDLVNELFAPDFVEHYEQPGIPPTREGYRQFLIAFKAAFPDLHYVIDDAIESGDRIVHRVTASGTMKGDFAGMSATGKHATWTEIHIARVADGRVTEHWGLVDQLGMFVQLGIVPAPGRVPVAV